MSEVQLSSRSCQSFRIQFCRALGLKRYHESRQTHFITFTCYHRWPLLNSAEAKRTFEALERTRCNYSLGVYGYVVMPEQVHLLLSGWRPDANVPAWY